MQNISQFTTMLDHICPALFFVVNVPLFALIIIVVMKLKLLN